MTRKLGAIGILLAAVWLSGCFSGGEVVDEENDSGTLVGADVGDVTSDATHTDTAEPNDVGPDVTQPDVGADVAREDARDTGPACDTGLDLCEQACVDTSSDPNNCGDCGVMCEASAAHTVASCQASACVLECEAGWTDLDGDIEAGSGSNGCELECAPTNGGTEICDEIDNDCDGVVDNGFESGSCTVGIGACEASGEYVCVDDNTAACNATAGTPGDEVCGDGVDNDCDGEVDEDDAVDAPTWYADNDGDGYGDPDDSLRQCDKPLGYVADNSDCDDADANLYEALPGYADLDGDGYTAGGAQTLCTDGSLPSGYVAARNGEDCNDNAGDVNPGVDELCGDGVDNDCDGDTDDGSASDAATWYVDCDGDGYAPSATGSTRACAQPTSPPPGCSSALSVWTDTQPAGSNTDCNDSEPDAFPGQTSYFSTPMPGSTGVEKWDYDCSGSVDPKRTRLMNSCSGGCIPPTSGWTSVTPPSCGQSGETRSCQFGQDPFSGYTCLESLSTATQSCH